MNHGSLLLASIAVLVSGCAVKHHRPTPLHRAPGVTSQAPMAWETLVTAADRVRLASLNEVWTKARAAVPGRLRAKLAQEGPLVDPAAALDLPSLPPGTYSCRLVRLGGRVGFATFKPDFCTVDGTARNLSLTKQSGSVLPGGWLFPDTDRRQIFLGTFRPAHVKTAPAYSVNAAQDLAGIVERVAAFRWRLVLTRAGGGAAVDLYELVPVTPHVPGS
ncbi:DUF4893 domain-containing protein [Sphingomonas sp.]|uniref:DUF4893 domain-containing protein n=1 Tax=Sphingomonas sp. TaxID=28214 RepID=UPI0033413961